METGQISRSNNDDDDDDDTIYNIRYHPPKSHSNFNK